MMFLNLSIFFFFSLPLILSLFQYLSAEDYNLKTFLYFNLGGTFLSAFVVSILLLALYSQGFIWSFSILSLEPITLYWGGAIQQTESSFLLVAVWINFFSKLLASKDPTLNNRSYLRLSLYIDLFLMGFFIALSSNHFVPLFLGWELLGIGLYLLLSFSHENALSNQAAFRAFLYDKFGSVFLLLGGAVFIFSQGDINFSKPLPLGTMSSLMGVCLFIGIYSKTFQLGFNTWMNHSFTIPTIPLSIIANFFLGVPALILVEKLKLLEAWYLKEVAFFLGLITVVLASSMVLIARAFKKMISYLTVLQFGLVWMVMSFGFYTLSLHYLCVLSVTHFILFAIEKNLSSVEGEPTNLINLVLPKTLTGLYLGLMILIGVFHTFLLTSLWGQVLQEISLQSWLMEGLSILILFFVTFVSWRPSFLLGTAFFKGPILEHHVTKRTFLEVGTFLFLSLGALMGGVFYFIRKTTVHMDIFITKGLLLMVAIGGSFVLNGLIVWLVKEFRKNLEQKVGWLYKLFLTQGYIESFYEFFLVKPFKVIASTLSHKVDGLLIEEHGFSGSISFLKRIHNLVLQAQTQTFSMYLLLLLMGCIVLVSSLVLK